MEELKVVRVDFRRSWKLDWTDSRLKNAMSQAEVDLALYFANILEKRFAPLELEGKPWSEIIEVLLAAVVSQVPERNSLLQRMLDYIVTNDHLEGKQTEIKLMIQESAMGALITGSILKE